MCPQSLTESCVSTESLNVDVMKSEAPDAVVATEPQGEDLHGHRSLIHNGWLVHSGLGHKEEFSQINFLIVTQFPSPVQQSRMETKAERPPSEDNTV